jgi:DegV family protein with EDD domain
MSIKIITDSCCDLPLDYVETHHEALTVIGMPIQFENETIIDDLGKTYDHKPFYDLLRNGVMPSTSQINAYRFEMAFKEAIASGYDVIYLGFSSGMSGTFNSAVIAKNLILEQFPNARIEVIDTLSASIGQGALIIEALDRIKNDAYTFDQLITWVEEKKCHFHHWFGVNDLNYLRNGGRISPTTALVGNVLHVKPTLTVDCSGVLKSHTNVRGRKKSLALLEQKVKSHLDKSEARVILLGHGNCFDDALLLKEMLEQAQDQPQIILTELSMTIASHVGPDMIAVAFLGDRRES